MSDDREEDNPAPPACTPTAGPDSTIQLVARARTGDRDAVDKLLSRHAEPLRRWASGRLPRWARDVADTEDLVQDTLLQTFRNLRSFDVRGADSSLEITNRTVVDLPAVSRTWEIERDVTPGAGERAAVSLAGIDLQVLGVPHGGFASIQNVGYVVSMGGRRVLHIGDADTNADVFRRLALDRDGIDVALLPMWFLTEREGQAIVRDYIKPRRLVGIHLPATGYEEAVASARVVFPGSDALTKLLEVRRY